MNAQTFLTFVQQHYDFERANAILAQTNLKNCWKQWFTCELVHMFNQADGDFKPQTDVYYPGGAPQQKGEKPKFLSYNSDKTVEVTTERRHASRGDFSVDFSGQTQLFEIRCGHGELFNKNKDLAKFEADVERIEALKQGNTALNVTSLFAFYGAFTAKQCEAFSKMDNSTRTSYVLDSSLTGSTSIARLSHMARNGQPRICLAALCA